MGKGGGGGAPTTQYVKTETSSLPSYAEPYYTDMMQRAQGSTVGAPYQAYTDKSGNPINRIADFTPTQQALINNQVSATGPSQFQTGTDLATAAGVASLNAGQYQPGQFGYEQVRGMQQRSPQMGAAQTDYNPQVNDYSMQAAQNDYKPNLQNFSMQGAQNNYRPDLQNYSMQAAQTDYNPQINDYQMQGPDKFGQAQADQYMSPYQQNVTDITKREALRDAKMSQINDNMGAARQGTYGGSRQLLAGLNRERNLGQNLADIQTKGQQSAFENAQQQFERDRSAQTDIGKTNLASLQQSQALRTDTGLKTSLANLDARTQANVQNLASQLQTQGLGADQALKVAMQNTENQQAAGVQNLASQLQTQGLGADQALKVAMQNTEMKQGAGQQNLAAQLQSQGQRLDVGTKTALANLDARQQTNVQNLMAKLQTQGLNADQALKAALANQSSGLEAQRMGEQSRQFGAQNALQGYAQAGQMAQTLGNLGMNQFQTDQTLRDKALTGATLQQAQTQEHMDQDYGDFMNQRDFPLQMLQQYSSLLRGVPVTPNATETGKAPNPSTIQQILGAGLGGLGAYKAFTG